MTTSAPVWVVPHSRIKLKGAGTPAAAKMCADLKKYGEELFEKEGYENVDFITMAQGNHHPTFERMDGELAMQFQFVSKPDPVYRNDPAGLPDAKKAVAAWERRFTGVDATEDNSFAVKGQGRYALLMGILTAPDGAAIVPNMRWRIVDKQNKLSKRQSFDYDVTATDMLPSIKAAVEAAGGATKVGYIYLCSPNNPTGRRMTYEEYRAVIEYVDSLNEIRAAAKLPPLLIKCDDPYIEAHDIRHKDQARADAGGDPYLATSYHAFRGCKNVVFYHSFSKMGEGAGSDSPETLVVSTNPEFTEAYRDTLVTGGGLGYGENFSEMVEHILSPENDAKTIARCEQAARTFAGGRQAMEKAFPGRTLPGKPNMVGCYLVSKKDVMGAKVQYPDGEIVEITSVDVLGETLGNGYGVGFVPEKNDEKIPTEGYDAANEWVIRVANNESPERSEIGLEERGKVGLAEIAEAKRQGVILQFKRPPVPAPVPKPDAGERRPDIAG